MVAKKNQILPLAVTLPFFIAILIIGCSTPKATTISQANQVLSGKNPLSVPSEKIPLTNTREKREEVPKTSPAAADPGGSQTNSQPSSQPGTLPPPETPGSNPGATAKPAGSAPEPYRLLQGKELPEKMQEWLVSAVKIEQQLAFSWENKRYLLIAAGEKPTSGYSVAVTQIEHLTTDAGKHLFRIGIRFQSPKPGAFVAQVITYPYQLVFLPEGSYDSYRDAEYEFYDVDTGQNLNRVRMLPLNLP